MGESKFYRWYDEPDFISVGIKKGYLKNITNRSIKKAGDIKNLSKRTSLNRTTIHNYINEKGINVRGLKTILDFLNIKYDRINNQIKKIGWNATTFNIRFDSKEMATILAASLADGHINQSHFMYKNKNLELINKIKKYVKKEFGNDIRILDRKAKNGINYILCPSFVKRQLERLGSPKGKKLFQNPSVPDIIKNGTKIQKKLFIRQFFDDEGWVESGNKIACSQSVETTKSIPKNFINKILIGKKYTPKKIPGKIKSQIIKPNILIDIKDILINDFNINSNLTFKRLARYERNKREYISATWELSCQRKEDVKKFQKYIDFSSNKQKLLREVMRDKPIPSNITYQLLNLSIKFQKEKGYFKIKDLQKYIDLEKGKIRKRLNTLVKKDILNNDGGKYTLNLKI